MRAGYELQGNVFGNNPVQDILPSGRGTGSLSKQSRLAQYDVGAGLNPKAEGVSQLGRDITQANKRLKAPSSLAELMNPMTYPKYGGRVYDAAASSLRPAAEALSSKAEDPSIQGLLRMFKAKKQPGSSEDR